MNQILDIAGSYLIGGFVLLMILGMMYFFNEQRRDVLYDQVGQYNIMQIGNIIDNDFNKMGYGMTSSSGDILVSLSPSSIKFRGDLDNNNFIDSVEYYIVNKNGEQMLQRREYTGNINNVNVWDFPVKTFQITAYAANGSVTTNATLAKNFLIRLETKNKNVDTTVSQFNVESAWQRHIYPQNLNM